MTTVEDIRRANTEAMMLRHPQRAMRVVLECAHMRLLPSNEVTHVIGASAKCRVCPDYPMRLVVDIQETGVLHEAYFQRGDEVASNAKHIEHNEGEPV